MRLIAGLLLGVSLLVGQAVRFERNTVNVEGGGGDTTPPVISAVSSGTVPESAQKEMLVGWWTTIPNSAAWTTYADNGVNFLHFDAASWYTTSEVTTALNTAQSLGMKVSVSLTRTENTSYPWTAGEFNTFVNAIKTHPAVWGWYLADEPELSADPALTHTRLLSSPGYYTLAKAADPARLSWLVICGTCVPPGGYTLSGWDDVTDIVAVDYYPKWYTGEFTSGELRISYDVWKEGLDYAEAHNKKPFVAVAQGFGASAGLGIWTDMSLNEMKYHVFSAVVQGVDKVLFWFDEYSDATLMGYAHQITSIIRDMRGQLQNGVPNDSRITVSQPVTNLAYNYGVNGNQHAILAVNIANRIYEEGQTLSNVQFTLPSNIRPSYVDVLGENRTIQVNNGVFTDTFAPFAVHAYVFDAGQTAALVTWNTDELSTSQVEYGFTTSYGLSTILDSTGVTAHSMVLSDLNAGTLYNYRVKSRDAASNLATSGNYTFQTTAAPAGSGGFDTATYVTSSGSLAEAASVPAAASSGSKYTDPVFGKQVMRVTDSSICSTAAYHAYAYWPVWNSDSTKMLVTCSGGSTVVINFDPVNFTLGTRRNLALGGVNWEWLEWSRTNPNHVYGFTTNKIYRIDVTTDVQTQIANLQPLLGSSVICQGSMSDDANRFGFSITTTCNSANRPEAGVYDVALGQLYRKTQSHGEAYVSRTGRYLVLMEMATVNPSTDPLTRIYDLNDWAGNTYVEFSRESAKAGGHMDAGGIGMVNETSHAEKNVAYRSFASALSAVLLLPNLNWDVTTHPSLLNGTSAGTDSWALVSTYCGTSGCESSLTGTPPAFAGEIFYVKTDGSRQVRRLAHSYSRYTTNWNYWALPRATPSFDGKYVAFDSNRRGTRTDVFVVKVY